MTSTRAIALALVLASWPATASAQYFTSTHTDCSGLQLYSAKGVPTGPTHGYAFRGICRELEKNGDGKVVSIRWEGWVEVESKYDKSTAQLLEAVKVTMSGHSDGPPSGTMTLVLKCAEDPILTGASCTIMKSDVKTPWPDFIKAWQNGTPFTGGKVTVAQATALSQQVASTPPPPPPGTKPPLQTMVKIVAQADSSRTASNRAPTTARAASLPAHVLEPPLQEIPLRTNTTVHLQSGASVAVQLVDGAPRWNILGQRGQVMRTFPEGSRAYRSVGGEILIDWGGGTYNAGAERPTRRLRLP
jgi:hypothetical protein